MQAKSLPTHPPFQMQDTGFRMHPLKLDFGFRISDFGFFTHPPPGTPREGRVHRRCLAFRFAEAGNRLCTAFLRIGVPGILSGRAMKAQLLEGCGLPLPPESWFLNPGRQLSYSFLLNSHKRMPAETERLSDSTPSAIGIATGSSTWDLVFARRPRSSAPMQRIHRCERRTS